MGLSIVLVYILNNINWYTTRAVSQSYMRARIVYPRKIFRASWWGGGIVGGAQIFYGVGGYACCTCVDWAYPLWEHRNFDGGPFVKG